MVLRSLHLPGMEFWTRGAVYDSLEIGQYDFETFTPYEVKVWVSEPNGMTDQLAINDTTKVINQYAGLQAFIRLAEKILILKPSPAR